VRCDPHRGDDPLESLEVGPPAISDALGSVPHCFIHPVIFT
jgi:hypothetical protein